MQVVRPNETANLNGFNTIQNNISEIIYLPTMHITAFDLEWQDSILTEENYQK